MKKLRVALVWLLGVSAVVVAGTCVYAPGLVYQILGTAHSKVLDSMHPPQWEVVLAAQVPDRGTVEYRVLRLERFGLRGIGRSEYALRWHAVGGAVRDYLVARVPNDSGFIDQPAFRATKDYRYVWLVGRYGHYGPGGMPSGLGRTGELDPPEGVIVLLDTMAGKCINRNHFVIDSHLPLDRQRDVTGTTEEYADWPAWATANSGILLAPRPDDLQP